MALSVVARRLTDTHRLAQARLGNQTMTRLREVWPTLDLNNLDGTFGAWVDRASPIVRSQRLVSARLAANYLTVFRKIELGTDVRPVVPVLVETVSKEALITSLRVTGPVSVKANVGRGMDLLQAAGIADERSSKAGARWALGGGRDTIVATSKADKRMAGWTWVASGAKTCDYCANLDGTLFYQGEAEFNPHDGCDCTAEPTFE